MSAPSVVIADVTLREHGQTVPVGGLDRFDTELRVSTAQALVAAGVRRLELVSCISPRVAPAMAEPLLREVTSRVGCPAGVKLVTLVPNRRGFETFLRCGLGPDGLAHSAGIFLSAVEEHNRENLGRTIAESLAEYRALAGELRRAGAPLIAYVSAAFGYRPRTDASVLPVTAERLRELVTAALELGAETITLSDLQGLAGPEETTDTLGEVLAGLPGSEARRLGYHPHHEDPAAGLTLVSAAYDAGIRLFDASLGATGGCVTGAPGNVPTEGVLALLEGRGIDTGVDISQVRETARRFHERVGQS